MEEVIKKIMEELANDEMVDTGNLHMEERKKLLRRRKAIAITGTVKTEEAKAKVTRVAQIHARDNFDVLDELTVAG